jgi:membrane protein
MARTFYPFVQVFCRAVRQWWSANNAFQFAAAIAYYAVFALTPLAVIAVAMAGRLFGNTAAKGELANQIETVVGPTLAQAVQEMITSAYESESGLIATMIGLSFMVVGAMGVFGQLQQALNFIWGVKLKPDRGVLITVRDSLIPFLMVLLTGVLLVLALLANALMAYAGERLSILSRPGGIAMWRWIDWLTSLFLLTLHFATIYKILPAVRIAWSVVWMGALVTALLFTFGNHVIGLYLAYTTDASAFGPAGSLIMILVWVYFSSQLVLFGAELTNAYAKHFKKPITPAENAINLPR